MFGVGEADTMGDGGTESMGEAGTDSHVEWRQIEMWRCQLTGRVTP